MGAPTVSLAMKLEIEVKIKPPYDVSAMQDARQKIDILSESSSLRCKVTIENKYVPVETPSPYALSKLPEEVSRYLEFGRITNLETRPKIIEEVENLTDEVEVISRISNWMREYFAVSKGGRLAKSFEESRFTSAQEVLTEKLRSCGSLATLFATLCRMVGIPARLVHGLFLHIPQYGWTEHAWVEVYLPDHGWAQYEPLTAEFDMGISHLKVLVCADWSEVDFTNYLEYYRSRGKKEKPYEVT
jgi:transglutaminase-like putative cysteine protease